ncbi:MAG: RnfABCDGE type electron transport complex subunit B [Candidatus Limiplasma sp.]|nr:RnfABCDGE type electron transport complex subunit B [Candidatus Limiplasma sp.]
MNVLISAGVLGALGLLFGLLLTLVNKVFEVPVDPKRDEIRAALPGANCGGCGYPGCDALADAILEGAAAIDACPVGGDEMVKRLAEIMGVASKPAQERRIATLLCQGSTDKCKTKFEYHGIEDCVAATLVDEGNRACRYACLGLGTCVRACKFGALSIDPHSKLATVDPNKCQSCCACVAACPKHILSMQPVSLPVRLLCSNPDQGHWVGDHCKVGCDGCELCRDSCKFGAIEMVDHLPQIDMSKCVSCMMCAEACPTGALWGDFDHRRIAVIDQLECIGCGICKKVCQFDAISGERKQPHEIHDACTGCGECVPKCPKKCITLPVRRHVRDAKATASTALPTGVEA